MEAIAVEHLEPEESLLTSLLWDNAYISSLVLQHLSGTDMLRLSEVSRSFNRFVAERGINKLQLIVNENWIHEFSSEIVKETKRAYAYISVKQLLRTRDQVFQVFSTFAEHLVSIDSNFDFEMDGILLPQVKILKLHVRNGLYFEQGLLSSVKNLKTLQMTGFVNFPEKVVTCLESNLELQELVLEENCAQSIFESMIYQPIGIHLKVLKITNATFTTKPETNFIEFLASQVDSLEELKLLRCDFQLMTGILNGMPNLKRFSYSPANKNYESAIDLQEHPNVEELNLVLVTEPQLLTLLPQFPNLKKLYFAELTATAFKIIVFNTSGLREIRFAYFLGDNVTADDLKDVYENAKLQTHLNMNREIEIISQI